MRYLALALPLFTVPLARASSFDCTKAHTARETTVCSSPELSKLDDDLAREYAAVRSQLTPASAALVQTDQRDWLAWMDQVCPAHNSAIGSLANCFSENYKSRIDQLTKGVQRIDGLLFYTRAHFVFVPGKTPANGERRVPNDPGFGYGEFAWPQIDAPDADHSFWNKAVYEKAVKVESVSPDGVFTTLDSSVSEQGNSDGGFDIFAANAHFIEVNFFLSTYGWGAAHPLTDRTTFVWNLDQHHVVTASDVLRPDTPWQTALMEPAIAKLQKRFGPDGIWSGKELHDGVATTLKDEGTWDLSRDGLTITFGQYAVGPYAQGMPEINFSWEELAPYLNPAFHPDGLPVAPHRNQ